MRSSILRFTLFGMIVYVAGGAFGLDVAASPTSWEHGTHFHGVTDSQWNKRDSDQFLNRHYARTSVANLNVGEPRTVRMIYFLPNDRPYRAEVVQKMKDEILNIQTFFAEQMITHGYGELTFRIETDAQGEPIVHRVDGQHPDSHYLDSTPTPMRNEFGNMFDFYANIYFVVIDNSISLINLAGYLVGGIGARYGKNGGELLVSDEFSWEVAAHELGHAFGLSHDFRDGAYIMSYGPRQNRLSACDAEYLSVHPYFNPDTPIEEGDLPTIELSSPRAYPVGSQSVPVRLKINDSEGLHQVLLRDAAFSLVECRGLAGEKNADVEFDYDGVFTAKGFTSLSDLVTRRISVEAVDTDGNSRFAFATLIIPEDRVGADVEVNIPDPNLRAAVAEAIGVSPSASIIRGWIAQLTHLQVNEVNISDLTGIEFAIRLEVLGAWGNRISDISPVAGLTKLRTLYLRKNRISDISPVAGLTNLESLNLWDNNISDISPVVGLTNLTELNLDSSFVSDLSPLTGLTNLLILDLDDNNISDISALAGLTKLKNLYLQNNRISDISPLIENTGLWEGGLVNVKGNPLSYQSIHTHIPILKSRGVMVGFGNRAHPALLKISGDNQTGAAFVPLSQPFVVEAQDANGSILAEISVRFAIIEGGGMLSTTVTRTDANGRAESTLTLGPNLGTNTVQVSATGIEVPVTFHAVSDTEAPSVAADVNNDGNVNVLDLVVIASELGNAGTNLAVDVNGDGVVNILDLIMVAGMFDSAAAAPAAQPHVPETLTAVEVQDWLTDARALEIRDPIMKRGFVVLEQLLISLTPKETELLANYPNPFNPETWIPYRLAEAAFVTLTIYDEVGRVVRTLDMGHRIAAVYESRSKAIYWDGRNDMGERVASGVYFYTLTAGSFSATQKMVILK